MFIINHKLYVMNSKNRERFYFVKRKDEIEFYNRNMVLLSRGKRVRRSIAGMWFSIQIPMRYGKKEIAILDIDLLCRYATLSIFWNRKLSRNDIIQCKFRRAKKIKSISLI